MTRIARSDVHKALDQAAKNILDAGGQDGRISRAEIKEKVKDLKGTEKSLTDVFFRFMDNRDFKTGATVTRSDVERAVAYAREKMVDKYDLNNNGLSQSEVNKMSLTGKLAVDLARQLKGAAETGDTTGAAPLAKALATAAHGLEYMSESDYPFKAFSCAFPANTPLTADAFKAAVGYKREVGESDFNELFANMQDPGTGFDAAEIQKWGALKDALTSKLTDVHMFIDQSDAVNGKVWLVGKAPDGNLAGLSSTRIWT